MKSINFFSISQLHLCQSASLPDSITKQPLPGINFRTSEISEDLLTLPQLKAPDRQVQAFLRMLCF